MNRGLKILAVALVGAMATCVDQPTPTSTERVGADSQATASLVSTPITHTLLTSGHDVNVKIYTTASIAPAPNALVTVAVLTHQSSSAAPAPSRSAWQPGR